MIIYIFNIKEKENGSEFKYLAINENQSIVNGSKGDEDY